MTLSPSSSCIQASTEDRHQGNHILCKLGLKRFRRLGFHNPERCSDLLADELDKTDSEAKQAVFMRHGQCMDLVIEQVAKQTLESGFCTVQTGSDIAADLVAAVVLQTLDLTIQVGALIMRRNACVADMLAFCRLLVFGLLKAAMAADRSNGSWNFPGCLPTANGTWRNAVITSNVADGIECHIGSLHQVWQFW